jgi:hypothetical protein
MVSKAQLRILRILAEHEQPMLCLITSREEVAHDARAPRLWQSYWVCPHIRRNERGVQALLDIGAICADKWKKPDYYGGDSEYAMRAKAEITDRGSEILRGQRKDGA